MADAWAPTITRAPIELRPHESEHGLVVIGLYALEPRQAMQLAIDLFHAAYAADARQRDLGFAVERLPLFDANTTPGGR